VKKALAAAHNTSTKVRGQAPLVDPVPEKVGGGQLAPWTPWLRGPCLQHLQMKLHNSGQCLCNHCGEAKTVKQF